METKQVVIVGATAPDIVKLISAINRGGRDTLECVGFIDDDPAKLGSEFMGHQVIGATALLADRFKGLWVVNNVGRDMPTRQRVVDRLAALNVTRYLTLVHPSVDAEYVTIGEGCIIQEGVILGPLCEIGNHCILYAHAVVGHESVIEDLVFVGNNAVVGARSRVGRGAFIGLNSVILPNRSVGAWSMIGAGAVVLRDVNAETAVFGNPARAGVQPTPLAHGV